MTAKKTAAAARAGSPPTDTAPTLADLRTPPWTTEERLQRIELLGQRINTYIQYMSKVAKLNGLSAEAKEVAVTAFYDRMVVLERQLGRIQAELELG